MAYMNPKYMQRDKTSELEKQQQAARATLLGIRQPEINKDMLYARNDDITKGGEQATAYAIAQRTKRQQAELDKQRQAMLNSTARNVDTSVGQGVGPDLTFLGGNGGQTGGSAFDKFMNAISQQESGGNYHSVNRDSGAMGKYQIMPGNLPSWSKQALGHSISRSTFLNSPELQEQIARYQMQQYYNKWGPRGAAIAWYAGPGAVNSRNLNKSQGNYPTISGYVSSVLRRLGL
jgi:hypothetical protein